MHGISMEYAWICMKSLASVCPLAQNLSSLLTLSHGITSSLQHSVPKTEPKNIPSEQLCFSVFLFGEYTRPASPTHDNMVNIDI